MFPSIATAHFTRTTSSVLRLTHRSLLNPIHPSSSHPLAMSTNGNGVDSVEAGKRLAAFAAVDENVAANMVVGVGSGSTIAYAVDRLAEKVRQGMNGECTVGRKTMKSTHRILGHSLLCLLVCSHHSLTHLLRSSWERGLFL